MTLRGNKVRFAPRPSAAGAAAVAAIIAMQALPVRAGSATAPADPAACPEPTGQDLVMPPEIVSERGVLRGTVNLTEQFQRLTTSAGGKVTCAPQLMRIFRREQDPPQPPDGKLAEPMPGPTLRARVGDLVQLTFVNEVNSGRFGANLDIEACTRVGKDGAQYPGSGPKQFDRYPDCLHASSTGNLHFHGTHTNPNATGDNVYLQIRPLPRDNQGRLTTTPAQIKAGLDEFYEACRRQLENPLHEWPTRWGELPPVWTGKQAELLMAYQQKYPGQPLWDEDRKMLNSGWPIYYIGAVPYCFALPAYTAGVWPPPPGNPSPVMGQAPGTHWYHAHKHGSTAINVLNGMAGAFIIEGQYDDDLNNKETGYGSYVLADQKPWNTRSQPLMVLNQLGTTLNLESGGGSNPAGPAGVDFSVNGRLGPKVKMQPGEVQLWRIVNASSRNAAYFMAPEGLQWRQLAQDGVQFADSNYQKSLNRPFYMAPGNRVDLLVKAPAAPASFGVRVQNVMARAQVTPTPAAPTAADPIPGTVLMTVDVAGPPIMRDGKPAEMPFLAKAPEPPKFLRNISEEELRRNDYSTKKLVFNSKPPKQPEQHTINDIQFQNGEPQVKVLLGAVEEWTVMNTTNEGPDGPGLIDHPFHIHINPFQIPEVFDPNENLKDPATGKLVGMVDPQSKTTVAVPRYVTDKAKIVDPQRQCFLDPHDPATWRPCPTAQPSQDDKTAELIWWDVFAIPSGRPATDKDGKPITDPKTGKQIIIPGYFKMRSRFVDYPGLYVLHCHILVHEDRGMMFSVEVFPTTPTLVRHH